jgi:hypothetical protein
VSSGPSDDPAPSALAKHPAPPALAKRAERRPYESVAVEVWVYEGGVMGLRGQSSLPPGGYDALLLVGGRCKSGARVQASEETVESLERHIERAKSTYVAQVLASCGGNRTKAAKLLGIDVRTVFRLLAKEREVAPPPSTDEPNAACQPEAGPRGMKNAEPQRQ